MMLFLIYFPAIFVHFQMNIELPVLHSTDVLLAPMKSEMDQLTKIRSHIRKVIPEALEARYADGRRTFDDSDEERENHSAVEDLLQQSADAVLSNAPSDQIPERQIENNHEPSKKRAVVSHDEAR